MKPTIIPVEMEDDKFEEFKSRMRNGDPRCRFQYGDRVFKARLIEEEELTPIGTKGTIVGSFWIEEHELYKDAYMVIWDGGSIATASVGVRLEKTGEAPVRNIETKWVDKDGGMYLVIDPMWAAVNKSRSGL